MNQQISHVNKKNGSILILALWTLTLLSMFAVYIGMRIQQRAILLSRLEDRSQLHYLAEAGVKKALAALKNDLRAHNRQYTAYGKFYRHNNPEIFKAIEIGQGVVNVRYAQASSSMEERFGFIDEESKINLNTADKNDLKRLLGSVIDKDARRVQDLVDAIVDWREAVQHQTQGFYSDGYYQQLAHPYTSKKSNFEIIDELLLVQGVTQDIFDKLQPFVTIYGDGKININSASREVLRAIGMENSLIDKLFSVRRGQDGLEATVDDYVFQKTFDIASEMSSFVKLEPEEIKMIDIINEQGKIKADSIVYLIQSEATLKHKSGSIKISCVYHARENLIEYWREKY